MTRKHKFTQAAMAVVLIVGLLAPAALVAQPAVSTVQPQLAALAAEAPDQLVRVIVQKAGDGAEHLVDSWGGQVLKDLYIINAFAAEMPAWAALKLAKTDAVSWVSLDSPVERSGKPSNDPCANQECPPNYFLDTLNVRAVWDMGYQGEGITVAVIDSGVDKEKDLQVDSTTGQPTSRVVERYSFNPDSTGPGDDYGHGTHVAGIIGGSGWESQYRYTGIAPKVNFISLKVNDDYGQAYESDVVTALQWVYDNKDAYNIRVVNLSLNSTMTASYHTSPMNAAAEILWFNGVVVVASSGNKGQGGEFNTANAAPANDPFIITVGASHEHNTPSRLDDTVAPFSAFGTTVDGFRKPDIIAPGKDIISILAPGSDWEVQNPEREVLAGDYFRISGTSMAAPMVTGAVALLLQAEPHLTPDQVKYRLTHTGSPITDGEDSDSTYPYLDVHALLTTPTTASANTGTVASQLLWTGDDPVTWGSVSWNSVSWNSVSWNSVSWNSVSWNSVSWNSVSWQD